MSVLYFAYGANLDSKRMKERCPSAHFEGVAFLPGYRLAFCGNSRTWNGPVSTIEQVERFDGRISMGGVFVPGALYEMSESDLRELDIIEGKNYTRKRVRVVFDDVHVIGAYTYIMEIDREAPPPPAYLEALMKSYKKLGFDQDNLLASAVISYSYIVEKYKASSPW